MAADELRELIERNAQVQEMTQHPGWALLGDYMRAQLEARQRYLLVGSAKDIEDYRKMTGWLQGVSDTLSAPATLGEQVQRAQAEHDAQRKSD